MSGPARGGGRGGGAGVPDPGGAGGQHHLLGPGGQTSQGDRGGRPAGDQVSGDDNMMMMMMIMMMMVMTMIRVTDTGTEYVSQLVIAAATAEDFVSYGCEATNMLGYDYVTMQLRKSGIKL